VCIAGALATTTSGPTDGAVLYMWPVLWMSYFFGLRGAVFIVLWVGLAQGLALLSMPDSQANADRLIDVLVSVAVVAGVVRFLASRNSRLVSDLEAQARIDPLTGLLNRRGLEERMEVEITRSLRQASQLAVVLIDIDHFKEVNDQHGHEIGDRVLTWIGGVLAQQSRGVDVAARTGGDEFMVLMADTDATGAHHFAERVRGAVESSDQAAERRQHGLPESLGLTVSVGVAAAAGRAVADLATAADEAMYVAKHEGRNRTVAADYERLTDSRA
jgi:diguanylate cyclase (GGDEF)-like protein